jgi:hypothetical protein
MIVALLLGLGQVTEVPSIRQPPTSVTEPAGASTGSGAGLRPYADTSLGIAHGSDVINRCTEKSPESGTFCFAYIAAVYDSVRAYETWLNMKEFCLPPQTPQSELRDAVVQHIERNPNDRLGQGASVVIRALKERYPCPAAPTRP